MQTIINIMKSRKQIIFKLA